MCEGTDITFWLGKLSLALPHHRHIIKSYPDRHNNDMIGGQGKVCVNVKGILEGTFIIMFQIILTTRLKLGTDCGQKKLLSKWGTKP